MSSISFSAAIFDLDGTLIDSNTVWEKVDRIVIERRGLSCSDEFVCKMAALNYDEAADCIRRLGIDITVSDLRKELNEIAVSQYFGIALKPGARAYLERLKERGVKIGLATASPEFLYKPALSSNGLYDFFDAFTTTEEVHAEKEHPDVYLRAAEKLGKKPCECTVFEDVLKGIKTSAEAGFKTVAVYDKYSLLDWNKMCNIADINIKSFDEML